MSVEAHAQEAKSLMNEWRMQNAQALQARNSIAAGIGSGIAIWLTLISIGLVPKDQAWYIIIGIVIVIASYIGINNFIYTKGTKMFHLNTLYRQDLNELRELRGCLSAISMVENITEGDIITITALIYSITQAVSYQIGVNGCSVD